MLRPKKKKETISLTKDSVKKARRIFSYMRPYRGVFIIGWFFLLFSSSVGLFFPYLLGQLLGGTDTSGPQLGTSPSASAFDGIDLNNINVVALLLLFLFLTQSIFSYFRIILFTRVTENTLRDIRMNAMDRLLHMPMDFFNNHKVGELTSRLSSDITLIQDTLRTTIAEFFRQIIIIVGSIVFIAMISWKLSLIMLATVPVMAVVAVIFGRFIRRLGKEAQTAAADSNGIIEESLMGITNVKTYTNEGYLLHRYKKAVNDIQKLNIKSGNWRGLFVSFIIMCLFGAIIFIIWQGLHMTLGPNPTLDKGDFFSFVMFTVFMGASIGSIPDLYAGIQKAIGATEHLMDIIGEPTEQDIFQGNLTRPIDGKIEFDAVEFAYPQRKDIQVLNQLSFNVATGEKVALVGSSGAGKSTIVSLILRFYDVNAGTISIDGTPIHEMDIEHLRSSIALVPQEVILFGGSIKENILFGKQTATDEEVIEAAKKANAHDFIMSFPEGMETQVGDRGIQLSGGQKQRIAIARAILKDPKILILDEATSALDAESEKLVQDALNELLKNRSAIIIAHRLATIRKADKILVLDKGSIVESGSHDELVKVKDGIYANLSELQFQEG
ncbi:MAG: ABC transporter transmembrane domain-containing protein [Crocinitomicaceae bacterium]|nr:ABC transporter transmembrane domain-containing protein [Crocinitomicaceae bacterium]